MNHATRFTKLALLLIVAGALALAGCGGGDDGVDESVHAQTMQELEAERQRADDAEARADDAEAAVEDATGRADDAEAAVEDATGRADDAEAAVEDATGRADDAEADRMAAEAAAAKELMDVQTAAANAAEAAKMASDDAAADAKAAKDATANIATLQTGEMSKMMAYEAQDAADGAMKAYMAAKMASDDAAAAMTTEAATEAKVAAEAAQADAEKYAMTASDKSDGAVKYAAVELMIDGTMKSVGDSSIDARMGMLTDTADDGSETITGKVADVKREAAGAVMGIEHSDSGVTPVLSYIQAVEARDVTIGKDLDTTDDMARLRLIDSRLGSKKARVYAVDGSGTPANFVIRTDDGMLGQAADVAAAQGLTLNSDTADATNKLRPVGMYYEADEADGVGTANTLDALDEIKMDAEGKEVFSYVEVADQGNADPTDDVRTTRHVIEISRTVDTDGTFVTYQHVDAMASAAPDGPDAGGELDIVGVTADIPIAVKYSHIHFGVWASLGAADKTGMHGPDALGIGFVQNFSGSGVTEKQGIGTATFKGDWVAVVQRQHSQGTGAFNLDDGTATLTANFGTDKFTGMLDGLATLEGSLSGNGFSGMKVTAIEHGDLEDKPSAFTGEFEGNIYGLNGEEAAGVFDFSSELSGAFRGAMGGARDGN